jgi:hypothetical protein
MAAGGFTVVHLDEIEPLAWRQSDIEWLPLRAALGATLVGMSAYVAHAIGQGLIEDHIETRDGRGHEEVYLVLSGRASFVIDEHEIDAASGTLIRVGADSRRVATAAEPGTVVLALGGPAVFEPAASEWIDRARPWLTRDPARARKLLDELRRLRPDSAAVPLGEALLAQAGGDPDGAREWLRRGAEMTPAFTAAALSEPTLAPLLGPEAG